MGDSWPSTSSASTAIGPSLNSGARAAGRVRPPADRRDPRQEIRLERSRLNRRGERESAADDGVFQHGRYRLLMVLFIVLLCCRESLQGLSGWLVYCSDNISSPMTAVNTAVGEFNPVGCRRISRRRLCYR